jgi:hypothetical protein
VSPVSAEETSYLTNSRKARFARRHRPRRLLAYVPVPLLPAGLYSLDVVLPPSVTTGQTTAWRPTTDPMAYVLTSLKTFGWLLTVLLLAGVTGLLRKT